MGAAEFQHGVDIGRLDQQHPAGHVGGLIEPAELAQGLGRLDAGDGVDRIDLGLVGPEDLTAQGVGPVIGGAYLGRGGLTRSRRARAARRDRGLGQVRTRDQDGQQRATVAMRAVVRDMEGAP